MRVTQTERQKITKRKLAGAKDEKIRITKDKYVKSDDEEANISERSVTGTKNGERN